MSTQTQTDWVERKGRKVVFEPYSRDRKLTIISGCFQKNGRYYALLKGGRLLEDADAPPKDNQVEKLTITKQHFPSITINSREDAVAVDFWKKYPSAFVPGINEKENLNLNCKSPEFIIRDIQERAKRNVANKKFRLMMENKLNNMDEHSCVNLGYALGIKNISALSLDEIMESLWEMADANPEVMLEKLKSHDLGREVVVKKAIALGILANDRGIYKWGSTAIGTSVEEILAYFQHNGDQYNMVRGKVASSDNLPLKFDKDNVDIVNDPSKVEKEEATERKGRGKGGN